MMAAGGKLLTWDIPPLNGHQVYFSREIYEKYSLTPTLSELLLLSKSRKEDNAQASNTEQENQAGGQAKKEPVEASAVFQEPRVPYPYFSSLTEKEQRRYLFLLSTYLNVHSSQTDLSEQNDYSQYLQMREFVSKEVAEFLKFAQNAAKSCTKDYDSISAEALLYTKQFLSSCIGVVKKYPECYTLHEVTSIMGGKFSTELTLKLEKNLLALGKVSLIKQFFPKMPAQIQLPINRKNESNFTTPEQKASMLHNDVSTDPNAEKLVIKYCPHIVLTSESLYALLNNHGLDYKDQWELPISVKIISVTGGKPVKVVYIDPPLPKKEMTVREKNQVFHEFLADFHMTKQSSILACAAVLDKLPEDPLEAASEPCPSRHVQVSDPLDLDFDTDVTELETFGSSSKCLKASKLESTPAKHANVPKRLSKPSDVGKQTLSHVNTGGEERSTVSEQRDTAFICGQNLNKTPLLSGGVLGLDCEENSSLGGLKLMEADPKCKSTCVVKEEILDNNALLCSTDKNDTFQEQADVVKDKVSLVSCYSDTDEEPLVIDTENKAIDNFESTAVALHQGPVADTPESPCSVQVLPGKVTDPSENSDKKVNASKKRSQRLSKEFDPVGQILQMQTELLKSPPPQSQGQPQANHERSLNPTLPQACPPLKSSESSTQEDRQSTTADTSSLPKFIWSSLCQGFQKGLLWDGKEDRSQYEAPQQGNLTYKLFSLDDMLLLVRSTIQKVQPWPRSKKVKIKKQFPVYVLPKLEYQAFYGAEALTEGEICRLWMESLLNSNSSFVIGHIDALTTKLFLLEKLSAEDLKRRFGTFKPANSLNILQHILKKVACLQEGSYLLAHAAGDSSIMIYKSTDGRVTRAYNLHEAHSDLPGVPSTLSVPWVPLDPNLPLPYHFAEGRVPCTFPPKNKNTMRNQKLSGTKANTDTPNHREQVSMETENSLPPANPFRKRHGAAQNKSVMKKIYRQANRGPNWKFWNEANKSRDEMA
ncbi:little elongation complex subunit 2 [Tiliqua scincoides]|uniref:little elongation complex subunit 2 n=1 Tax=Tiliqua scincoides TaxID=71010 RepID=UPI00346275D1